MKKLFLTIIGNHLPFWNQTNWAMFCFFLIALFLIYYFFKFRSNKAQNAFEQKIALMAAENEKALNDRKLAFFTQISQEFRSPLTLIINPVKELLVNPVDKESASNSLQVVYSNANRLLGLVDQLVLFGKADSETDNLKIVSLNLANLCKEVFLCFSYQARIKNISFHFTCETECIEIFADREKLEIALFNLFSNAFKFTPENGSVACSIFESDSFVNIEIEDSGCGIPSGLGEQLFEKFYQVKSDHQHQGGFGIGLFLVKKFIDSHKGTISYSSINHSGSTFKVSLLKGREHFNSHYIFEDVVETSVFLNELMDSYGLGLKEDTLDQEDKTKNIDFLRLNANSLLIIDDNPQIRNYIKQIFSSEFEVYESCNGYDGLETICNLLPDIVICDVMMPGLSGIELCSRVKEDPLLNHIPVLLLTSSSSPDIKLKGIEGGADDYISKPFDKDLLIARVTGILKSKSNLKRYFYNEVTLKANDQKVPAEFKEFLEECIKVVEDHLTDCNFSIKTLTAKMGMSHSNLYKKIRSISGQSANGFIRFIRLRKSAEMFLNTECTVSEAAYAVGINDPKYFREQFSKLFGLNPSDYIKKFREPFHYSISKKRR